VPCFAPRTAQKNERLLAKDIAGTLPVVSRVRVALPP
jgi:hypothetical protein